MVICLLIGASSLFFLLQWVGRSQLCKAVAGCPGGQDSYLLIILLPYSWEPVGAADRGDQVCTQWLFPHCLERALFSQDTRGLELTTEHSGALSDLVWGNSSWRVQNPDVLPDQ